MHASRFRSWTAYGLICAAVLTAGAGCIFHPRKTQRSSSVVAFLYPTQSNPRPPTSIPVLRVPLRVGIAFVPTGTVTSRGAYIGGGAGDLSELQKSTLLQKVAAEFKGRDYIEAIEIVPSMYLRPGGGFDNLEQVSRMLNVDVVALVAYDQVQFTDQNFLSLAYWTIVGAYVVHGDKNDTQTLMEAAVYDVPSRHLLFRAAGTNQKRASSAAVYVSENLRADSAASFQGATDELIANLKVQLEDFRTRVRQAPETVARIERKPGYTGGGSIGAGFALALALLAGGRLVRRRA
jgi:rhombotail lipoprotein